MATDRQRSLSAFAGNDSATNKLYDQLDDDK